MRHYRTNTPEALARIVVATVLADGGIDKTELDVLSRHDIALKFGMHASDVDRIFREFCEDMECSAIRDHSGHLALDRATADQLLSEVDMPELQMTVLATMLDVVAADTRLNPGELTLVSQAMTRWGLELHAMLLQSGPFARPPT